MHLKVILDGGFAAAPEPGGGCPRALRDPEVRDDAEPQIGWDSLLLPCL